MCSFFIPLLVIMVTYYHIYMVARNRIKKRRDSLPRMRASDKEKANKVKKMSLYEAKTAEQNGEDVKTNKEAEMKKNGVRKLREPSGRNAESNYVIENRQAIATNGNC